MRRSLRLEDPRKVVRTRTNAGERRDDVLARRPEAHLLERPIQPTSCYTEVRLMRRHVMHAVVPARQNDMRLLKHLHPTWQPEVSVRPLRADQKVGYI